MRGRFRVFNGGRLELWYLLGLSQILQSLATSVKLQRSSSSLCLFCHHTRKFSLLPRIRAGSLLGRCALARNNLFQRMCSPSLLLLLRSQSVSQEPLHHLRNRYKYNSINKNHESGRSGRHQLICRTGRRWLV